MVNVVIFRGKVIENSEFVLRNRVSTTTGSYITQAAISSIRVKVFDLSTTDQVGVDYNPLVSAVVYDTLQPTWSEDKTGFNLAIPMAGSYVPNGAVEYQVEIKFTPVSGNTFYIIWRLQCENIFSE